MTICGIDLDKSEARFCILAGHTGDLAIVTATPERLGLTDHKNQDEVRAFQTAVQRLFDDNHVDVIAIRERLSKGRMKGGTITFKLEGLIQVCRQPVHLISPATIRKSLADANIDFTELPISKFQHEAYGAAYCLIKMMS